MLVIIIYLFAIALGLIFFGKGWKNIFFKIISFVPFGLFLYFLGQYNLINNEKKEVFESKLWIPDLGINLDFHLNGLSLLFALMITGVGTLIFVYSASYLKYNQRIHYFFGYLFAFMGAMLGLVLSDNMIVTFLFWELTSIISFFLIGFNFNDIASRKSALWALSITGFGGLLLLSAFICIEQITGTYQISALWAKKDLIINHPNYLVIIVLCMIACFTKSAQFPFHFWLPGAMKAPTPVSAYLHSATMVKAGIFILAKFSGILSDDYYWSIILIVIGGFTMIFGALNSIFKIDLKEILAYSTISALGLLVFLLGINTPEAFTAFVTFIGIHSMYKAALFLNTGIIDHTFHTRNITEIGGLRRVIPALAIASGIAALSSAGIPLTFGFIGKELAYQSVLEYKKFGINMTYILFGVLLMSKILLAVSGFLAGIKPFFGEAKFKKSNFHKPDKFLQWPVIVLSIGSIVFGIFPFMYENLVLKSALFSLNRLWLVPNLHIWHGFNTAFIFSLITIGVGILIYYLIKPSEKLLLFSNRFESISTQNIFYNFANAVRIIALKYTRFFHNGYLRVYLMHIILFAIILIGYQLYHIENLKLDFQRLSPFRLYEFVLFLFIIIAIFFVIVSKSRLVAVAAMGIVGYMICLIFVVYGAPDLAMTQFAIDTLTVVLFVLILFKLPPFLKLSNTFNKVRDGVLSAIFGLMIAFVAFQAILYPSKTEVSRYYADNAYLLAKGKNVVNVILVDFRGIDTMIETVVLAIAAVGVLSILQYKSKDGEKFE